MSERRDYFRCQYWEFNKPPEISDPDEPNNRFSPENVKVRIFQCEKMSSVEIWYDFCLQICFVINFKLVLHEFLPKLSAIFFWKLLMDFWISQSNCPSIELSKFEFYYKTAFESQPSWIIEIHWHSL